MKPIYQRLILALLSGLLGTAALAQTELEAVKQSLIEHLPAAANAELTRSPVPGLYQLIDAGKVAYVTADGRYLLDGRLIDLVTRQNLTDEVLAAQRVEVLGAVAEEDMIIFEPKGETRHTLTTFTDIDCAYCRKMHAEVEELNKSGIRVRYMLYPRAGDPSESYDKAVSVWCAADQQAEMTRAKSGAATEKRDCATPIKEHMALATQLGLRGTPFTVTDTGRVVSGYVPAADMVQSLDKDRQRREALASAAHAK